MEFHETGWLIIIKWISLNVEVSWEGKLWVMFNQLMADWGKVCQSKKWSAAGLQNLFQLLLAMLLLKAENWWKSKTVLEGQRAQIETQDKRWLRPDINNGWKFNLQKKKVRKRQIWSRITQSNSMVLSLLTAVVWCLPRKDVWWGACCWYDFKVSWWYSLYLGDLVGGSDLTLLATHQWSCRKENREYL